MAEKLLFSGVADSVRVSDMVGYVREEFHPEIVALNLGPVLVVLSTAGCEVKELRPIDVDIVPSLESILVGSVFIVPVDLFLVSVALGFADEEFQPSKMVEHKAILDVFPLDDIEIED